MNKIFSHVKIHGCKLAKTILQTCHSIEMKNLDLTNKKSGSGGKNRDHGPIGYKKK